MSTLPLHLTVIEINVGLFSGRTSTEVDAGLVGALVTEAVGGAPLASAVIRAEGLEPTYWASFLVKRQDLAAILSVLHFICPELEQEAIAVKLDDGGALVGPKATEWGPFNPAYFQVPAVSAVAA